MKKDFSVKISSKGEIIFNDKINALDAINALKEAMTKIDQSQTETISIDVRES